MLVSYVLKADPYLLCSVRRTYVSLYSTRQIPIYYAPQWILISCAPHSGPLFITLGGGCLSCSTRRNFITHAPHDGPLFLILRLTNSYFSWSLLYGSSRIGIEIFRLIQSSIPLIL